MVNFYSNEIILSLQKYKELIKSDLIKREDIISSEIISSDNLYESYQIRLKLKFLPLELLGESNEQYQEC